MLLKYGCTRLDSYCGINIVVTLLNLIEKKEIKKIQVDNI